ncbi:hypothetical protein DPMN_110103 [Dreissena polymorpha]|uniref:Uncharacterized protein n=1 Tax=Dreissena polymorpha TaxID=45954 RepID=A0A9D4QMU0_DREPO|nr:hypothetical protein DPMN_110103 [Dreissena polymorpha]
MEKNAPHTVGHVFQATGTNFELAQDIIGTYLLTKFHNDRTINMASREIVTPPWRPYIIGTNRLTKVHDDRTINVASRVLIRKNALPPNIIRTNLLTKFHEDRKIDVASRVLTRFYYSHIMKNAPPPGGHIFHPTGIIFALVQDIIWIHLLTKFNEDQTINVASRVKNATPLGSHVFQATVTIFEVIQDIIKINRLTKFHEDWTINVASRVKNAPPPGGHFHEDRKINVASRVKNAPTPGGHVFQPTSIIFERFQDIICMNLPTKFHEDRTIILASRVLTRFYSSHIRKRAPTLNSHVFQANVTIFELIQDIIETNLLTKFYED